MLCTQAQILSTCNLSSSASPFLILSHLTLGKYASGRNPSCPIFPEMLHILISTVKIYLSPKSSAEAIHGLKLKECSHPKHTVSRRDVVFLPKKKSPIQGVRKHLPWWFNTTQTLISPPVSYKMMQPITTCHGTIQTRVSLFVVELLKYNM